MTYRANPILVDEIQTLQHIDCTGEVRQVFRLQGGSVRYALAKKIPLIVPVLKGWILLAFIFGRPSVFEGEMIRADHNISAMTKVQTVVIHGIPAETRRFRLSKVIFPCMLVTRNNGGVSYRAVFRNQKIRTHNLIRFDIVFNQTPFICSAINRIDLMTAYDIRF
jgi:hypothetical protein